MPKNGTFHEQFRSEKKKIAQTKCRGREGEISMMTSRGARWCVEVFMHALPHHSHRKVYRGNVLYTSTHGGTTQMPPEPACAAYSLNAVVLSSGHACLA